MVNELIMLVFFQNDFLLLIGIGDSAASAVCRILPRLVKDDVLRQYSWKGTVDKLSFQNHRINDIIFNIINGKFSDFSIFDYEKCAKNWIRHTAERIKRRQKQNAELTS